MTGYAKLTSWLIGVWLAAAITLSALHVLKTGAEQPPLPMGLAAGIPVAGFLVWFGTSAGFRRFLLSLNPRVLTAIQSWRMAGFIFLVLATYGILPKMFALPAGWGDMTIGATAPLAALLLAKPERRGGFLAWQMLGMLDLVTAVLLGTLSRVIEPHGIAINAMTVLPLSLIPTFAVPLLLMLHIVCVAQAVQWRVPALHSSAAPLVSPAA